MSEVSELQGKENLLNDSDTVQDVTIKSVENGPVKTEVTSVAAEEAKTGIQQKIPTKEELVARATASYIRSLKQLSDMIRAKSGGNYKISRHGMNRVILSILQLPQDDMDVTLQGNEEKLAFALGQRIIADRFLITQHHISEQIKKMREEQAAKAAEVKPEEPKNEQA